MWLVLAGTLGLAQWVTSSRSRAERVGLNEAFVVGDVKVQLPGSWQVEQSDSPPSLDAAAPSGDRAVAIQEIRVQREQTARDIMEAQPEMFGAPEPLEFPKLHHTGLLAKRLRGGHTPDGRSVQMVEGCVIIRPGVAVVIRVEQEGTRVSNTSVQLLKRIAATMEAVKPVAEPSAITFTFDKPDDHVDAQPEKGREVYEITSLAGSGSATLRLTQGNWPVPFTIRLLQFQRLEAVIIDNGQMRIQSGLNMKTRLFRLEKGSRATRLSDDPRFDMPAELKDGYVEFTIPGALCGRGVNTLQLQWVDATRE